MEYENKDLCSKCGGMCCKKSGCDYFVSDFERITKEEILKVLETGNVSIVSAFSNRTLPNGKLIMTPLLYLRARNKDRDIVDLFSMKKECSMLTSTGCKYELKDRPGGGVNLIPGNPCRPLKSPVDELLAWLPYQTVLSKIVKRLTGKSVDKVIREDVEEVLYQILTKQFDGVSKIEVADIISGIEDLVMAYPEEYEKAKERARNYKVYEKKTNH